MKRIIILVMVLLMIPVSIGGCFVVRDGDGRGGRDGGHDRGGDNNPGRGHDKH